MKGIVELTIGYHQLSGKLVPLKKPLAVLEKVVGADAEAHSEIQYQVGPSTGHMGSVSWRTQHRYLRSKAVLTYPSLQGVAELCLLKLSCCFRSVRQQVRVNKLD